MNESSAASAFRLYRAARFTECLEATAGATDIPTKIVRARAYLRLYRSSEVLAELADVDVSEGGDVAATIGALRSRAMCHGGDSPASDAWLRDVAPFIPNLTPVGRSEIGIARSTAGILRGDSDGVRRAARAIEAENAGPWYRAEYLYALGVSCMIESDYRAADELVPQLVSYMETVPEAMDTLKLARTTQWLAALSREMYSAPRFAFVSALFDRVAWTPDLKTVRFSAKRSLAWAHALHGTEEEAHRLIFELIDEVPNPMWRTYLYADQAYLVQATGYSAMYDPLLRRAVEFASETRWDGSGDERVALLNLVVMTAERDPSSSAELLKMYDAIGPVTDPSFALAHDKRLRAFENHARGALFAATGAKIEGTRLLLSAYGTFREIGYTWRAGAVSLLLHAATGDRSWLVKAEEAVRAFPDSAIAREIRRRARGSADQRMAALSPAQRRVFELLCQGKSNKELSTALGITVNTARNHVTAVLERFGARSRAHLAALAREANLDA